MPATSPDFSRLMLEAMFSLQQAAKLPGLTDVERAQARAAAQLASLHFHKIHIMNPTHADARAVRSDLEHVAAAIDPLIWNVGEELRQNFHGVEVASFENQILGGLENSAIPECDQAEARAIEERFGDVLPRYGRSRQMEAVS